jgi:hypothetical protein
MRALVSIVSLALLVLSACGDNFKQTPDDARFDAPPQASGPCLLRPTDVPVPPTGALPCDLLPPGFVAEAP